LRGAALLLARRALPREVRLRFGTSPGASPCAPTTRGGIPNFPINVCASNGARNLTSVLSKKQNTSRGSRVGGFFGEIFSASAGSDPVCQALIRFAQRSNDLSEYPLLYNSVSPCNRM